jgi:hypothetical protein
MEIFLDGGLFEFFAAVMLAYALNFISKEVSADPIFNCNHCLTYFSGFF